MGTASWYEKDECLRTAYFILVIVRFLFPCLIQNGYLYPDEFFQSSEIMAKDILHINSTVTWEWNETFPVRSPISAFLTSGIPFLILNFLSKLNFVDISPYLLLVFPRIYITLISILSFDIPVYIIGQRLKLKPFRCLFVLSTSYVTHTFATRPFSNTLETGILGILLVLLMCPSNKTLSCNGMEMLGNDEIMPSHNCILTGCLTSLGVFCRQTFLVFALVPYLGNCIDQVKRKQNYWLQIMGKLMLMALGFLIMATVFVFLDSIYFGYLEHGKIVLTPWNFIKYNSLQSHTHGHHPFFTHFVINIPLLFGPIAFLFYFKLGSLLVCRFNGTGQINQQTQNQVDVDYKNFLKALLLLCVFVPVLILSFIPHQEPRFLMPILLPLILLFSSKIVGPKYSPTILMSWSVWNVIGYVFFGVLHQGGVVPSLLDLHKVINDKVQSLPGPFCHHVVYFHTYMPPSHLLAWPNKVPINGHRLYIHDLAGSSQEEFNQTMLKLKLDYCVKNQSMLYVTFPATVKIPVDFEDDLNIVKFFPHLTLEDPPNFHQLITDLFLGNSDKDFGTTTTNMNILHMFRMYWNHFCSEMEQLKREFSLNHCAFQF